MRRIINNILLVIFVLLISFICGCERNDETRHISDDVPRDIIYTNWYENGVQEKWISR